MKKLEESGLTLNYQKCQIAVTFIEHLRNTLSDQGLQVSRDKVDAIVHAPRPKDQSEVRSFLGLVQYCWRFIPTLAIVQSPLWDTKTKTKWKQDSVEENAFHEIKNRLTQAPVRQDTETRMTTDTSPVGIGAVLEQKREDGQYRPLHYASRKPSAVESR